jgi:hypothetical protein
LGRIGPSIKILFCESEVGIQQLRPIGERCFVNVENQRQLFIGAAAGGAAAQECHGAVGLDVQILGIAAALACAVVICAQMGLEASEVGDALGGCVRAENRLVWLLRGKRKRRGRERESGKEKQTIFPQRKIPPKSAYMTGSANVECVEKKVVSAHNHQVRRRFLSAWRSLAFRQAGRAHCPQIKLETWFISFAQFPSNG